MWVLFLIFFVLLIFFLLLYPFKVTIWNKKEYLYIKISWLITIKINLLVLFDNQHNDEIKKQAKFIKLLNKVRIESIYLKMSGLNLNYEYSGAFYGYLNVLLAFLKNYLMMRNSDFDYDIEYMGEKSIKFKSIIYAKVGIILKQILGGKKYERASD